MMRLAIAEAEAALARGEVPVGAVIAQGEKVLARAGNKREIDNDPTAHAEIIALRDAARALGGRRLTGCTLYVTLEPCPMCAGAIALSGLDALYFGARDPRMGCCGSVYRLTEDAALGLGITPAHGGLLAEPCAALLQEFFIQRRS
jgi:tRNA(adenine34) deaminase